MPPRWAREAKQAVGTAYSSSSRVWYTVAAATRLDVWYVDLESSDPGSRIRFRLLFSTVHPLADHDCIVRVDG
jgi:Glucodextranase, domain N